MSGGPFLRDAAHIVSASNGNCSPNRGVVRRADVLLYTYRVTSGLSNTGQKATQKHWMVVRKLK